MCSSKGGSGRCSCRAATATTVAAASAEGVGGCMYVRWQQWAVEHAYRSRNKGRA